MRQHRRKNADVVGPHRNEVAAEQEDVDVRSFECLGACDIAPMASVDGVYVGPLTPEDTGRIMEDLRSGADVLREKQLRYRPAADPKVRGQ